MSTSAATPRASANSEQPDAILASDGFSMRDSCK